MLLLVRLLVACGILVLPFLALALLSGTPEGMIWMIFPVLFALPALAGALVIFAPVEWLLDRQGMSGWKNRLVPLAGWLAATAGTNLVWTVAGGFDTGTALLRRPSATLLSFTLIGVLGALWGCYWRLTDWAARRILRR